MTKEAMEADEAMFREMSDALASQIEAKLVAWTIRNIEVRAVGAGLVFGPSELDRATIAGERCKEETGSRLRDLLGADIDDQWSTPLGLLRDATSYATGVLAAIGVPEVIRDEFERRRFPLDIYGLAPASLADIDESLAEPGMIWGAAKAHIHRRRHSGSSD